MSVRRKNQSSFSFELENLTSKLAKIAEETAEIAQSTFETRGFAKTMPQIRICHRTSEGWHQTAIGVNETAALAQKLGVSPWDLAERRRKP